MYEVRYISLYNHTCARRVHTCHLLRDIPQICCSTQTGQHSPLQSSYCPVWALQHYTYNPTCASRVHTCHLPRDIPQICCSTQTGQPFALTGLMLSCLSTATYYIYTRECGRCKGFYLESENSSSACLWHPGKVSSCSGIIHALCSLLQFFLCMYLFRIHFNTFYIACKLHFLCLTMCIYHVCSYFCVVDGYILPAITITPSSL